jgi:hypothetical protein
MVAATPAWLRMPTPTTLILATLSSVMIMRLKPIASFCSSSRHPARAADRRGHGEGHVGLALVLGDVLDDHVDVDVGGGQRAEDRGHRARPVGTRVT